MSKVKVCRVSGQPVKLEHIELFQKEHRALYDKVMAHLKQNPDRPEIMDKETAERFEKLFTRLEKGLLVKYPNEDAWPEIKEQDAWLEKVAQYGPIMLAKSEEGELVYVIYDKQF
jgi:hypothetical protein